MKKQELLQFIDDDLMGKLFGFCYARTYDSYEAQDLCSDIIYALLQTTQKDGEITNRNAFIWRVARNVYAAYSDKRKKHADAFYDGDADAVLQTIADDEPDDDRDDMLRMVHRRIAFLTKAYRDVMIMYYVDGLTTAEIAGLQNTSEGAVRQRLFSAREKIKNEVKEMNETYNRPIALEKIDYVIWGNGSPGWGDPRKVCTRMFSRHIIWLCKEKPMRAAEIAEELNVPTVYVEEELEILANGENGKYGLLRRLDNGRYAVNFILLDKDVMAKANALYTERLPIICDILSDFIEKHKQAYLSFPYLNHRVDLNLILWQQIHTMSHAFSDNVEKILAEKYFSQYKRPDRPFSVFGYVDNGKHYGAGWDGVQASNVCGFSEIHMDNIYLSRIKKHFNCGLNVSNDPTIQMALRSINGLELSELSEADKEYAAKAIECGYLYREENMVYTKILVCSMQDCDRVFDISRELYHGFFEKDAEIIAEKIAALIQKSVPEYLLGEWGLANSLAGLPVIDAVVEALIEKGILIPPENGIGAEGCWMSVC